MIQFMHNVWNSLDFNWAHAIFNKSVYTFLLIWSRRFWHLFYNSFHLKTTDDNLWNIPFRMQFKPPLPFLFISNIFQVLLFPCFLALMKYSENSFAGVYTQFTGLVHCSEKSIYSSIHTFHFEQINVCRWCNTAVGIFLSTFERFFKCFYSILFVTHV